MPSEAEHRLTPWYHSRRAHVAQANTLRPIPKHRPPPLQYKLHEALGRLRDLEAAGQLGAGVTAGGGLVSGGGVTAASRQPAAAGALLPKATHGSVSQGHSQQQQQQQQQQTHKLASQRTHQGAASYQAGVRQAEGGSGEGGTGCQDGRKGEHERLDGAEEDEDDEDEDEDALLALCEAEERLGLGLGGQEGHGMEEDKGAGRGEGWEEGEGDGDATQYDRGTAGTEEAGGGGLEYDEDVPVLPRAFSGVFAGLAAGGMVEAGATRGSATGGRGVVGAGAAAGAVAGAAAAAASVRTVASFAAKVSGMREDQPSERHVMSEGASQG